MASAAAETAEPVKRNSAVVRHGFTHFNEITGLTVPAQEEPGTPSFFEEEPRSKAGRFCAYFIGALWMANVGLGLITLSACFEDRHHYS